MKLSNNGPGLGDHELRGRSHFVCTKRTTRREELRFCLPGSLELGTIAGWFIRARRIAQRETEAAAVIASHTDEQTETDRRTDEQTDVLIHSKRPAGALRRGGGKRGTLGEERESRRGKESHGARSMPRRGGGGTGPAARTAYRRGGRTNGQSVIDPRLQASTGWCSCLLCTHPYPPPRPMHCCRSADNGSGRSTGGLRSAEYCRRIGRHEATSPAVARIADRTGCLWPSRSSKLNDFHLIWQGVCHLSLVITSNLACMSHRFPNMASFPLKNAYFHKPLHSTPNLKQFCLE